MKLFITLVVCFFMCNTRGQELSPDITGMYTMSSGNPEGGSSLIIMPDNKFVVTYFGGVLKGIWSEEQDVYNFTYITEPKFVLYARVNTTMIDTAQVQVRLDGGSTYALRFNNSGSHPFTPIFNADANCFSYPYVYQQQTAIHSIDAYVPDQQRYYDQNAPTVSPIYRFLIPKEYNEFIIAGLTEEYTTPQSFRALFSDNNLQINDDQKIRKRKEYKDIRKEDREFIESYTKREIFPEVLSYDDEFFPFYDNPTQIELQAFTRITPEFIASQGIQLATASLFIASCED